jgi:hypothetical protein
MPLPLAGILLSAGLVGLARLRLWLRLAGRSPLRVSPWTIALARDALESIDRRQPTPWDRGRATG